MRIAIVFLLVTNAAAWGQQSGVPASAKTADRLRIPNRPAKALFEGEQGAQKAEIDFDQAAGTVTLKLLVQDAHGYFIPGIRRENFAVYENGVRQTNVTADVEHAPASVALLMEYGGRHAALNQDLLREVSTDSHALLQLAGSKDKIALWTYADRVSPLADFTPPGLALEETILSLKAPDISEANLYDAEIFSLEHIRQVPGRKAVILISSGVDTFSKATFDDALRAAQSASSPVYAIGIGDALRNDAAIQGAASLVSGIDWNTARKNLGEFARASGGRLYVPQTSVNLPAIYDDMMENLKVRYVITYKPSSNADPKAPRTVRVELVNPKTGTPLEIEDMEGRRIRPSIVLRQMYIPQEQTR